MRKANELKTICDLLEGYNDDSRYEVLQASTDDEGKWKLIIKKIEPVTVVLTEPRGGSDDN